MIDSYLGIAAFIVVTTSAFLWFRGMYQVSLPENRIGFISSWVLSAVLGMAALMGEPGGFAGTLAGIGTFASVFFLITVFIGSQKVGGDAIAVGDTIPHFTALDEHKELFDSHSLSGHLLLIKFFRAHW